MPVVLPDVVALFVDPHGVYCDVPGVEPWGLPDRDARLFSAPARPMPWPGIVAHPPCAAWGAYSKPTPTSTAKGPLRGDDGGCFEAALRALRWCGGVLEHPRGSYAWAAHGIPAPPAGGGWLDAGPGPYSGRAWTCEVEQGHYGHVARKPTWLLYLGRQPPPPLVWGPSDPAPVGTGARRGNLESMSKRQRAATPRPFADLLVALARHANRG